MTNYLNLSSPTVDSVATLITNEDVLSTIHALFEAKQFSQAYQLFAKQIDFLLDTVTSTTLREFLAQAPDHLRQQNAHYLYCKGMVCRREDQREEAIGMLERASQLFLGANAHSEAARCLIEIAHVFHSQENFSMATHYLTGEVLPLLKKHQDIGPDLHALFFLHMAHLDTDIGQLEASQRHAEKALQLYAATGDLYGQFCVQLRIGRNFTQTGNYADAHDRLQLARRYFHIGKFKANAEILLLNAEIHLRWYQGLHEDALNVAMLYRKIADYKQLPNARVYARILIGNLYRDKGEFAAAAQWYDSTQEVLTAHQFSGFQPWLYAHRAWLSILEGKLDAAEELCHASLQTSDRGQKMSFQVQQAVLHLVHGRAQAAEPLLQESLSFYKTSGDPLACGMIRIYLAYSAMRTEEPSALLDHLDQAFALLDERQLDLLPHWWHPRLVAEVCSQALAIDLYPETVRQLFINRLGDHGVLPLTRLLRADDLDVRQRAHNILNVVTGQNNTMLAHLPDSRAKQILQELLEQGHLLPDGYPRLEYELMTARQRRHPNPTLIVVFVLHVLGYKRNTIADRLDCSVENVRNYITTIYHRFSLPASDFNSRLARRENLAQIARDEGFVL